MSGLWDRQVFADLRDQGSKADQKGTEEKTEISLSCPVRELAGDKLSSSFPPEILTLGAGKGASERAEPYQSVARLIGLNYSGQVRVSGNGVDNVLEIVTYGRSGQFIGGRYFRQEEYC